MDDSKHYSQLMMYDRTAIATTQQPNGLSPPLQSSYSLVSSHYTSGHKRKHRGKQTKLFFNFW
jgi:hypothetical protein